MLSLETHLGVTTSPHAPFPAGYVTLPVCSRSPPLRLALAHSSEWTSDNQTPSLSSCIPNMLQCPVRVIPTLSSAGRTEGDICRPDLVRRCNHQVAKQVRINLVTLARLARAVPRIERLQAHLAHQTLHTLAVNCVSADFQLIPDPATAVERPLQINLVNLAHQHEVVVAGRSRLVVRARTRYLEQLATPYFWQRMLAQDQFATLTQRSRPSTLDKKSFSIAS